MKIGKQMIAGLRKPEAYAHPVDTISLIETHISWVILTGDFAYKIKKPVNFGFLDFSTLAKRLFYCREELRLNQRFAEKFYLDVVPVTGTPDCPIMDGIGTAIEYAVKMRQFPSCVTLAQLAEAGELNRDEIDQLAGIVAEFHQHIASAESLSPYGENLDIKKWFDENFDHIKPRLNDAHALEQIQSIQEWGEQAWRSLTGFMQERKRKGFIRECHGDLHLGNMTMIEGDVVLFDCIEFNPMLRWIDVISEVAFLMIDLLHSSYQKLAFRFLNRYLSITGDYSGLRVLRYYLVYRAMVRAKVTLLRQEQQNIPASVQPSPQYRAYADLAQGFTGFKMPLLILTHGFSGSGKSWLSSRLAEHIGAIHLRSDVERKRLHERSLMERSDNGIGEGLYSPSASQKTYQRLAEQAKDVLRSGFPVIVDAAFLTLGQRQMFVALAAESSSKMILLDCRASMDEMRRRIEHRLEQNDDPSDASLAVLMHQIESAEDFSPDEIPHVLAVDTESTDALNVVINSLSARYPSMISEVALK